jgi:hypothetical protein
MRQSINAGFAYFLLAFGAGFGLGVMRAVLVAPVLGETFAVALELPIILLFAWFICRWLTRLFLVPARLLPRALMGILAFALLMAGEVAISLLLAGRSLAEHVLLYREAPHILGLAGQIAFALFPVVQIRTANPPAAGR